MGISGIYAGTVEKISANFSTGGVGIRIQTFRLNSENEEVKYEEYDKVVSPAEVISFIPKIENDGENCYVRVKFFYINEDINASEYITGISNDWVKFEEYYYYKKVLTANEVIKIFDTIQIPQNIDKITNEKEIKLEITTEAVQEKNFEPDYTSSNPWQGVVPVKSINTKYDIDTDNDSNIIIEYENGAGEDIKIQNNFFEEMKSIMPGDSYSSSLQIKNTNKKGAKYYLRFNLDEISDKTDEINKMELLKQLTLTITNKNGKIVYSGQINYNEKILLGEYNIGDEDKLDLRITAPEQLANQYANINAKSNWVFSVDYNKENTKDNNKQNRKNPQTGDKINMAITIFLISTIGLVIVMLLDYKEKRDIE